MLKNGMKYLQLKWVIVVYQFKHWFVVSAYVKNVSLGGKSSIFIVEKLSYKQNQLV